MKKILIFLGHPAHFHFFKNIARQLQERGHDIKWIAKSKDLLEPILQASSVPYENVSEKERSNGKVEIALNLLSRVTKLYKIAKKWQPDLLIGSAPDVTHVGKLLGKPSIVPFEDDLPAVPQFDKITSRWADCLVTPRSCQVGKWEFKTVKYDGYQELAYLAPAYFVANWGKIARIFDLDQKNFIIRFSKLNAYHDVGKTGITDDLAMELVRKLKPYGRVHISSERKLVDELEKYRITIDPLVMHDALHFADLYIGDSQTMAAEAAILGTPSLRFNDFVGKLGYLEELEHRFQLTYGIRTGNPENLLHKIDQLLDIKDLKGEWAKRKEILLKETIDVTRFFVWLIEEFPDSKHIASSDPTFQDAFRG